jgi:hypothetical protein
MAGFAASGLYWSIPWRCQTGAARVSAAADPGGARDRGQPVQGDGFSS